MTLNGNNSIQDGTRWWRGRRLVTCQAQGYSYDKKLHSVLICFFLLIFAYCLDFFDFSF